MKAFLKRGGDGMATCRECKYYKPIDEEKGDCFGVEVSGDMDAEKCPANAFEPK